jgi:hypothetical protein
MKTSWEILREESIAAMGLSKDKDEALQAAYQKYLLRKNGVIANAVGCFVEWEDTEEGRKDLIRRSNEIKQLFEKGLLDENTINNIIKYRSRS